MVQWISFFYFLQYLHQIFKNLLKQGQFWYLLVLSFSKLSLLLIFGQVKAEKIELKDTGGHFHFSHFQVIVGHSLNFTAKNVFKINIFSFFSRDSDLTTPIENEDMLKKMRICINISSSFLTYPHLWSTISVYPHLF